MVLSLPFLAGLCHNFGPRGIETVGQDIAWCLVQLSMSAIWAPSLDRYLTIPLCKFFIYHAEYFLAL